MFREAGSMDRRKIHANAHACILTYVCLQVEQPDLLLPPRDLELARSEHGLLHVALLVEDAQLVVAVDELDARVVALLHRHLVPGVIVSRVRNRR